MLDDDRKLKLISENGFFEEFKLRKIIGKSCKSICYEAVNSSGHKGVLKEYFSSLESSQIYGSNSTGANFDLYDTCEYIFSADIDWSNSYRLVKAIKSKTDDQGILPYIPEFEFFHDISSTDRCYVWNPNPPVIPFNMVCSRIAYFSGNDPVHPLLIILKAIKSLCECICDLHCRGLIHRDIKPSNFGFMSYENNLSYDSIQLFDIDTLCSVVETNQRWLSTAGFIDDDIDAFFDNKSDIYSIGSTMIYALMNVYNDKIRYIYKSSDFGKITELMDQSVLLSSLDETSLTNVKTELSAIVLKCLSKRCDRYEGCEDLIEDIEQVIQDLYRINSNRIAR